MRGATWPAPPSRWLSASPRGASSAPSPRPSGRSSSFPLNHSVFSSPCRSCSARSPGCPIGMLTDRFGGRLVFAALFAFVAVAAALVPGAETLRPPPGLCLPARHGGCLVRGRRGLLIALVPAREAGDRARDLRAGQHGALGRGVPGAGGGRRVTAVTRYSTRHAPCCRPSGPLLFHFLPATRRSRSGPLGSPRWSAVLTSERSRGRLPLSISSRSVDSSPFPSTCRHCCATISA